MNETLQTLLKTFEDLLSLPEQVSKLRQSHTTSLQTLQAQVDQLQIPRTAPTGLMRYHYELDPKDPDGSWDRILKEGQAEQRKIFWRERHTGRASRGNHRRATGGLGLCPCRSSPSWLRHLSITSDRLSDYLVDSDCGHQRGGAAPCGSTVTKARPSTTTGQTRLAPHTGSKRMHRLACMWNLPRMWTISSTSDLLSSLLRTA